eukprot:jgi/Ulvmu1/1417/UM011_0146.1
MECCEETDCFSQAFRELTDEEILALDFDPDFDQFLVDLQRQGEVPGLSLENIFDDAAADDSIPMVAEGSTGENRSDSFPRSPPESIDNDSCHVAGSAACQWNGHTWSFEGEGHRVETQQESSLRPFHKDSVEEMRSQRLKERNRLYAARTRQRKNRMMQDLRQRCQDLEAENYELRARVADLEARLASTHEGDSPILRDCQKCDVPGACSPQTSDGSGASMRAKMTTRPPAPSSSAPHLHRGLHTHTKAANKLRFTAAAASRRGQADANPSPAVGGGSHDTRLQAPCQSCGVIGQSSDQPTWSLASRAASAVCESSAKVSVNGTQRKRSPMDSDAYAGPPPKNRRFATLVAPGRLPVQGMVTPAMMLLVVLSCLVLIAIPAINVLIPAQPRHESWSSTEGLARQISVDDHMHGRALLSAASALQERSPASALATLGDARVMPYVPIWQESHESDSDPWTASSDEAEQILESAAFVCNHTACVAIPVDGAWADVVPLQPLEVRPEQPGDRDTLDEAVFSTLDDVTPIAEKLQGVPAQYVPTAPLRGGGFIGDTAVEQEEDCGSGSCFSFQHIAGKALNMAGLMAPEMCELVHRTTFSSDVTGSDVVAEQPSSPHGSKASALAQSVHRSEFVVPQHMAATGRLPGSQHRRYSSEGVQNSTEQGGPGEFATDQTLSVLFPVWAHDAEDGSALTPIRHLYIFVLEQEDLLTYQCSISRPLYM